MNAFFAFFRLELAEAVRSRWLAFTAAVYVIVLGGFVGFGLHESRVLGFTGLSRVVLNAANAIVLAVPLVALVATCQSVVRARQSGFFELMLTEPVRRRDWFVAAAAARVVVVAGPLVVLLGLAAVAGALGSGDPELAGTAARVLAVTVALAASFLGLGLWISSAARTPERAVIAALAAWLVAAALHDFALFGAMLRLKLAPHVVFGLAASNPVEAARIAILGGVDPDLSVLGPVGFWLAHRLGPSASLAVAVLWPLALATFATWRAERRLVKQDLVA